MASLKHYDSTYFDGYFQDESKKREETSLVQCSWCDSVFLSWQMLTRHWLLHHLQWNTNCAVCSGQLNNSVLR